MKKNLVIFFLFTLSLCNAQVVTEEWVKQNYNKIEAKIPMRDGAKLFTAIHIPKTANKNPILLVRTPYSCAPYGQDQFSSRLWLTGWRDYLKENYILVIQDVRGRWMSEGEFMDVRPYNANKKTKNDVDEASDTYDAIEWLIKNVPNNNGNVGVFGVSYPGFYSTMAALSGHPALKAVSPQAPVTEWFLGDDFHHNGVFMIMDAFSFYYSFGQPRPFPTMIGPKGFEFSIEDNYEFFLKTGALKNFTKLMGDSIKFWNDMMKHPNYDEFWKARDARRACINIKPAMLVVGGTFDAEDCYGAWNLYKAIEKQSPATNNKLVMGPWFHGGWSKGEGDHLGNVRFGSKTSEYYKKNIELPFFDHYLKGKGDGDKLPEASVFFTGANEWKTFTQWPPKEMETKTIYLSGENQLTYSKSQQSQESFSRYISDPSKPVPYTELPHMRRTREYMTDDQRFAARRPDVLVFETPVLEEDLTLAGPVVADLKVMISTTDADFVVKVIDVFPDKFAYDSLYCCEGETKGYLMSGYQMLVRGEIMRGKFRNSFEKPEPFKPGEAATVKFELPDVAHTFKKGHKLMIQVQSTWFPLADRNPQQFTDIYQCDDKDFVKSEIKVYHDKINPSAIILPVLKK